MVGNDIVDLTIAGNISNWQRKRFLQKIFTTHEIDTIHMSKDPFKLVWRLWSMKESAYKFFLQQGQKRFFDPQRLQCCIVTPYEGLVSLGDRSIYTSTRTKQEYIFTSAAQDTRRLIKNHIFRISQADYKVQTIKTHKQIAQCLITAFNLNPSSTLIRKTSDGIPEVYSDGKKLPIAISLTHDGHYGACSWGTYKL